MIRFKDPTLDLKAQPHIRKARMKALTTAVGGDLSYVREMSGGAHVLKLPQGLSPSQAQAIVAQLGNLEGVEYAEPDPIVQELAVPSDDFYPEQWHYHETYGINAPRAWDHTLGSPGIIVAVLDSGITRHDDLNDRLVPGYDFVSETDRANDGDGRDSDPSDPGNWITAAEASDSKGKFYLCGTGPTKKGFRASSWHGTRMAGIVGAAANGEWGVGVNWGSRILPVRVGGKCGGPTSDIVDGMRWSVGIPVPGVPNNPNPAKVLNMSLGMKGTCTATWQSAVNDVISKGATIVAGAGNDSQDVKDYVPANCAGVLAVAATTRSGNLAPYSNYGSMIKLSAPGGDTTTKAEDGILSTSNDGNTAPGWQVYAWSYGTSIATPHVSGTAALVLSVNPQLEPSQVIGILRATAKPFPAGSSCTTAKCGAGIVDAGAAVWALLLAPRTNPSVASQSDGRAFVVAYQAINNHLMILDKTSLIDTGLGMMPGTSPSITVLSPGKYAAAFQANTANLSVYLSR